LPVVVTALGDDEVRERATVAAQRWQPGASISDVHGLNGGASSLTYRAKLSGPDGVSPVVLKVAPPGVEPVRNRDVLRQAAILKHLEHHPGIRTPRVLFEQAGLSLKLPPFFAMEFIEGECVEPTLDDPLPVLPEPGIVASRAREAARMLAALHKAPTTGPAFERESATGLQDEIHRWERALGTVEDALRPNVGAVTQRLLASIPDEMAPVLLHGDFRLGNTLCAGGEVAAVIDWEIWGLGDPRIDLLWFLLFTDPERLPTAPRSAPGMPGIPDLVAEYEGVRGGPPLRDLDWFDALIQFKQAAVTALIVKHNRRRPAPDPRLERSSLQIEALMLRALSLLA
jgi:aminoglycoside phosphotransferase (APT) family kinase protein